VSIPLSPEGDSLLDTIFVNFNLQLTDWTYLMGDAVSWAAQYYDPGRQAFVDGGWRLLNESVQFKNVSPNGYVVALLYNGTTTTPWIYSSNFPTGKPQDGETWRFWLHLHGQPGDLELIAPVVGWLQVATASLSISRLVTYAGWLQVATASLSISRLVTYAGWLQVATASLSISRLVTYVGWLQVAASSLSIARVGVPPTPPPEEEGAVPSEEEGAVPWGWIALGGGGLALIALALKKKGDLTSRKK
jgi:hypothetical protein